LNNFHLHINANIREKKMKIINSGYSGLEYKQAKYLIYPAAISLIAMIALSLLPVNIFAQQNPDSNVNPRTASIKVMALASGDSVVLRWVVNNPGGWRIANRLGFVIDRIEVDTTLPPGKSPELRLTPKPLFPWSLDEWKARSRKDDKFSAIAAQCLYGKQFMPDISQSEPDRFVDNLRLAAIELENRYSFAVFAADMSAHVAEGSALRFADKNVKKGKAYIYTVKTASVDTTFTINEAITTVIAGEDSHLPPPPLKVEIEELDKKINIRWANLDMEGFTAYNIYRSEDGGKTYKILNTSPILPMQSQKKREAYTEENAQNGTPGIYTDSTIYNNREYTYCLRGITPFAEESECAVVTGMGRDLTPPSSATNLKSRQTGKNQVEITWKPGKLVNDLAGYNVIKSRSAETGFYIINETLLPANIQSFTDPSASEDEPYYIIESVDSSGNVSRSLPMMASVIDSSSPAKPTGLRGSIDTNGVVTLTWQPGTEYNLKGYRVFWANDSAHEFTQIADSIVEDTTFTHKVTINTLSKHVYYRICAVSRRYMPSDMSDILSLNRPDIIPPAPAVFTSFDVTDSSINLKWEYSRSNDVSVQQVLRRSNGQGEWEKIAELKPGVSFYSDKNLVNNANYEPRRARVAYPLRAPRRGTDLPSARRVRDTFCRRRRGRTA
jgi:fibronectin type 3 domain-containing protein